MPGFPTAFPREEDLPDRLKAVLSVIYLIFNEGYAASSGDPARPRWTSCAEAIRMGRLLRELMPDEPEVMGLQALMLLVAGAPGRPACPTKAIWCGWAIRTAPLWAADLIAEGQALVRRCLRINHPGSLPAPGRDQRRARGCKTCRRHGLAADSAPLRPAPFARSGAPSSRLNRAVVVAEVAGPGGPRSRSSTTWTSTPTISTMPSAPICCSVWGAAERRPPPTWPPIARV